MGESVSACGGADHNARKTSALNPDSDGDGLLDGQEIGMTSAGVDTLVSVFKGDSDPSSTTNPNAADTDGDGLSDRLEDANLNGRVDSGEPNPSVWDTDGDGLCDGLCSGKGEDLNLNGIRDQDADGNYTETDFLANDSDVDGIRDGQEVNGTWSYKSGTAGCPGGDKSACVLDPLNPDFDGDGLRDGQETAGWMVGIWRERTMEKVTNYTVNSNPAVPNSDADALTDFEEFMNGSDPRSLDTDKDGITDTQEIERKSNITGVEGSPPRIENVTLNVGITWEWWNLLYLPSKATVTVSFNVSDNVGIAYVDIRFTRHTGSESRRVAFSTNPASYTWSSHIEEVFNFSILEALVAGADVNITAYDVNGNGAWGEFHQDSVVEAAVKAVAALFSAIAKVIVEAASAAIDWIWEAIRELIDPYIRGMVEALKTYLLAVAALITEGANALNLFLSGDGSFDKASFTGRFVAAIFGATFAYMTAMAYVFLAINLIILPFTSVVSTIASTLVGFVMPIILSAFAPGASSSNVKQPMVPSDPWSQSAFALISNFFGWVPLFRAATQPYLGVTLGFAAIMWGSIEWLGVATGRLDGAPVESALGLIFSIIGLVTPLLALNATEEFLLMIFFGVVGLIFSLLGLRNPEAGALILFNVVPLAFSLIDIGLALADWSDPAFRTSGVLGGPAPVR